MSTTPVDDVEYSAIIRGEDGRAVATLRCSAPATVDAIMALESRVLKSEVGFSRREEIRDILARPRDLALCTPGRTPCLTPIVVKAPPVFVLQWHSIHDWLGGRDASFVDYGGGGDGPVDGNPDEGCDPRKNECYRDLTETDRKTIDQSIKEFKTAFNTRDAEDACNMMMDRLRQAMTSGWIFRGVNDSAGVDGMHFGASWRESPSSPWKIHIDPRVLDGAAAKEGDPESWVNGISPGDWSRILLGTLLHEAAHTMIGPNGQNYDHRSALDAPGAYVSFPFNFASGGVADGRPAERCDR